MADEFREHRSAVAVLPFEGVAGGCNAVGFGVRMALSGWGAGKVRWGRIDDRDRCRLVV